MRKWQPWTEIRYRPITAIIVFFIGIYMIWFGVVLINRQAVPELDPRQFSGPLLFSGLHTWGYVYITLGCVKIFRIFLMQYVWVSRILHLAVLLVLTQWAIALDTSTMSLLQPATTLAALLSLFNPWITNIIMRSGEPEYLLRKQREQEQQQTSIQTDKGHHAGITGERTGRGCATNRRSLGVRPREADHDARQYAAPRSLQ